MMKQADLARAVVDEGGTTLASEAGIRMKDRPAPLWELAVLANLVSAPVPTTIATEAAHELNDAGGTTPDGMASMDWQQRVDALDRGHYVRYDESTATRLGECAELVREEYDGDLRHLADEHDRRRLSSALQEFPGIGPTGASIFCREAQEVWPWLRPFTDKLTRKGAERVGLTTDENALGDLVPGSDMAALAAGLAHAARDDSLVDRIHERAA